MFHCQVEFPVPSAEAAHLGVPADGWTMFAGLAHPKSPCVLRLSGPNVTDAIVIEANTLSLPDDVKVALATSELCRELGNNRAFEQLVKREVLPGKPEITSGNTMAPCVVIGERAAEMIKSANAI